MTNNMQPRDRLIPWYFVAFFIFLTIIYTIMATIAIRTQTGVVAKHPYEQGLAYNKIVDASQKQEQLGWAGEIGFSAGAGNSGKINFTIKDKSGASLKPENVIAKITRPTQDGMDFEVELAHEKSGAFASEVKFPLAGLWEIRIFVKDGDNNYQQSKRVVLQ